jgi:hypothetical protein
MAAASVPAGGNRRRATRKGRFFFIGMGLFAIIIVSLTFVPEYRKFTAGSFPIAPVLHLHAAIMGVWVLTFVGQAGLAATGRLALHRQIGRFGIAWGWIAWIAMVFVELRVPGAHPLTEDLTEYDWFLPGPYVYLTFPIFLAWATHERRRPQWHKRLMTFALFLPLQAVFQRIEWLPPNVPGYWNPAGWLDVCLIAPIIGYDLFTLRRLHPATIRGIAVLLGAQAILFLLWGTDGWRHFAYVAAHWIAAL